MEDNDNRKIKESRLGNYLSLDYTIGLLITVVLIITGLFTRNNFFYRLGIIFMIITPSAGLLICLIYYIAKRKLKNILITIAVLLILTASALIGLFNFG